MLRHLSFGLIHSHLTAEDHESPGIFGTSAKVSHLLQESLEFSLIDLFANRGLIDIILECVSGKKRLQGIRI